MRNSKGTKRDKIAESGEKPARGRPASPKELVRSCRAVTFFTESEFSQIEKVALATDQSLSATLHELTIQTLRMKTKALEL